MMLAGVFSLFALEWVCSGNAVQNACKCGVALLWIHDFFSAVACFQFRSSSKALSLN